MTRRLTLQLFALVSLVATIGYTQHPRDFYRGYTYMVKTPVADLQDANPDELDGADDRTLRLREGMKFVNRVGELREAGGRILFYPDGDTRSLQLLENLALERVSDDLDQTQRKWSVTGIITEYRGGNYLLLHRAVLKARSSKLSGSRK
jgi:hypothetical protein